MSGRALSSINWGPIKLFCNRYSQKDGMGKQGFAVSYPQGPANGNWESYPTPAKLLVLKYKVNVSFDST